MTTAINHRRKRADSFRAEVVALHRRIFDRNRDRINESVAGYTAAFRRYEREYHAGVRSYDRRASFTELERAIARARVVYVGDYHTLPQAQRTFLRMLRRLPPDRPVTLAMEFVQGRRQGAIDAYLRGEFDRDAFLKAIEHDRHWVFGAWSSFAPIFELARERGYSVIGIDKQGRGPAGASLRERDHYAARRIADTLVAHPDHLVFVLVGELHIAPSHLPRDVRALDPGVSRDDELLVYQNCEEIYWQLEARSLEHKVELVRIRPRAYGMMNTPPIVCQQSFLNWLEADDDGLPLDAVEENFRQYARLVMSFFDLDIGSALDEVEVATVVDLSFLQRLQQRGDFTNAEMLRVRKQILANESYYIPRAKMVYLGNLSVNHASEEATHFVRDVCAQPSAPKLLVDSFYAVALEEAIGFLGSKLVNHKRKCTHPSGFENILRSKRSTAFEKEVARLVLRHARMERGANVRNIGRIYECSPGLFNAVTHAVGYALGDRLYYALVDGIVDKSEVRTLFLQPFSNEGDALTTYLYYSARTDSVQLPERF